MTVVRVTISRRDIADTAITVKSLLDPSLHLQSFSPTPGIGSPGTEVDTGVSSVGVTITLSKLSTRVKGGGVVIVKHYNGRTH